jgi:hypothetical protein
MSIDLEDRSASSEALSDAQWKPRGTRPPRSGRFGSRTDITSAPRFVSIPFGHAALVFSEPPPAWSYDLLTGISKLGELEEGWDSYGARPVDPNCAVAAVGLVFSLLGPSTPKPYIVPTNRGGLQLEWHRNGIDLEIEIQSPSRLQVTFQDERTEEEIELTLTGNLRPLVHLVDRLKAGA